jgi:hypothetical protein
VLWRSPETVPYDDGPSSEHTSAYQCIILVQKQPKPETMYVEIPVGIYDQLLDVPVEW